MFEWHIARVGKSMICNDRPRARASAAPQNVKMQWAEFMTRFARPSGKTAFLVSLHADERCEEREIASWQVAAGLDSADLLEERQGANRTRRLWSGRNWSMAARLRLYGHGCRTAAGQF